MKRIAWDAAWAVFSIVLAVVYREQWWNVAMSAFAAAAWGLNLGQSVAAHRSRQ